MSKKIFESIEQERNSLKQQREELDDVIKELKEEVVANQSTSEKKNFREKSRKTSMEKAETIRAFVELHKLKTQLTKIIIDTYEKEHKLATNESEQNKKTDEESIAAILEKVKKEQING